jgi:hypothetical protein
MNTRSANWICTAHGYVNCSRCETPSLWRSAPATVAAIARDIAEGFARQRAAQIRRSEALEAEIAALKNADTGQKWGRSRRILELLTSEPKPSRRTVQWHLKRIEQRANCAKHRTG